MTKQNDQERKFTYQYPHPAVTVDCVVFGLDGKDLEVLLIRRKIEPFRNSWALPGGFVRLEETLDEAARRELQEETGVTEVFLEQFYTFGELGRDPRERVISVAYYVLVKPEAYHLFAQSDASEAAWYSLKNLPKLAFDHEAIIGRALKHLREKIRTEPIGFELLPAKFKLPQLQRLYEVILERTLDKRNFRRRILHSGLLVPLDEMDRSQKRRPARLFRFDHSKYLELKRKRFNFVI